MARMSFEDYSASTSTRTSGSGSRIGYFSLRNDGDTMIVRFNIHGLEDIAVDSVHRVTTTDGKTRDVSCLRATPHDPIDHCPLCANGEKLTFRLFIPLIAYHQNDTGNVELTPSVWNQGVKTRNILKGLIEEYGDLTNTLFKITRHGVAGSKETTYSILPANPNVYKDDIFVKDFSAFDDPSYINRFVLVKTAAEIEEFYNTGDFPFGQHKTEEAAVAEETPVKYAEEPVAQPTTQPASPLRSTGPIRATYNGNSNNASAPTAGPRRYTY